MIPQHEIKQADALLDKFCYFLIWLAFGAYLIGIYELLTIILK